MQYVDAHFSLKFEPILKIRRDANTIEDKLQEYYLPPQTMPVPDDFAAEAPRIIMNAKNSLSTVSFSQYSVDLIIHFDGEYISSFDKTKTDVINRINLLKDLIQDLNRNSFYFFGLTYNARMDTKEVTAEEYIQNFLNTELIEDEPLYEASQRIALVEDNKFFVNELIGTYREYQSNSNVSMDLLNLVDNKIIAEGINLSIDVNNRFAFIKSGSNTSFDFFESDLEWIYKKLENRFVQWKEMEK